jgi:ATP-dependent Clp protease ATP-binding subunit ClpA
VLQLEAQLSDRNVTIELTPAANAWLAERGYDAQYGARPLGRLIQEQIKKPLAEELLFGRLTRGGAVRVVVNDDNTLGFEIVETAPPLRPRSPDGGGTPDDGGGDDAPTGGGVAPKVPELTE